MYVIELAGWQDISEISQTDEFYRLSVIKDLKVTQNKKWQKITDSSTHTCDSDTEHNQRN